MRRALAAVLAWTVLGPLGAQTPGPLPAPVVDPAPGTFAAPVTVDIRAPEGARVRYRFLETPSTQTFPWAGPLVLDVLPGENRSYTLRLTTDLASGEALTQDYRYQIFVPALASPTVQPAPGFFTGAVTLQATLPVGWTISEGGRPVTFPFTIDAPTGDRRVVVLQAQGPGNVSRTWTYVVDRRDQEAASVDLISPVPGTWGNLQTLAATFRGVDRVLWS
ncbi:MAG TPA: hypothetical protein VMB23_00030 [Spirochaetia bacterium]|nr:hypothetical protein [Spirochaetia bacterium]